MERSTSEMNSFLSPNNLGIPTKTDVLNLLPSAQGNARRQASVRKSIRKSSSAQHQLKPSTSRAGLPNQVSFTTRKSLAAKQSSSGPLGQVGGAISNASLRRISQQNSVDDVCKDAASIHGVGPEALEGSPSSPGTRQDNNTDLPCAPLRNNTFSNVRSMSISSNASWAQRRRDRFTDSRQPSSLPTKKNSLDNNINNILASLDEEKLASYAAELVDSPVSDMQWDPSQRLEASSVTVNITDAGHEPRHSVLSENYVEDLDLHIVDQYSHNVTFMQRIRWKFDLGTARMKDVLGQLSLTFSMWNGHLKTIEGKFGTGVVSYFVLLRGMVFLNLLLFLPILCFMMIPQWAVGIEDWRNQTISQKWFDHFADTLTGGGYLDTTPLFYSAYSSTTVGQNYKMPEAFFYTSVSVMVISFLIISRRTYKAYKESLSKDKENFYSYTSKIFGAWDYSIANEESGRVKAISIHKNLLEEIAYEKALAQEWTTEKKVQAYTRRALVNLFVMSLLTLASLAIYYASEFSLKAVQEIQARVSRGEDTSAKLYLQRLAVSLTIAMFDVSAPIVFGKLAEYEQWRTPREEVKYTLYRTIFLKLSSLAVLMVSLFIRITGCDGTNIATECLCWESVLAQELWQLSIISFIFIAFSVLVGQFVWRILWERYKIIDTVVGPPEFQIAKYILELIFMQALVWLGYYFSPGMPLIVLIQLFLLFYVQMYSLFFNLQPSHRHYRAGSDDSLQLLMLATLLLCLFPLGYAFVTILPSRRCGPFRSYSSTFAVTQNVIKHSPTWVVSTLEVVFSSVILVPLFIVFLLIVFFYYARQKGQRERAHVLKDHLIVEGKDKQFLIAKVASQQGVIHGLANRLMDVQKRLLDAEEANMDPTDMGDNLPDVDRMMDELSFGGSISDDPEPPSSPLMLQHPQPSPPTQRHVDLLFPSTPEDDDAIVGDDINF